MRASRTNVRTGDLYANETRAERVLKSAQGRKQCAQTEHYDSGATDQRLSRRDGSCLVRPDTDDRGRPTSVSSSDCHRVFHQAVHRVAWKWGFYPVRDTAVARSEATFTLAPAFILR